MKGKLKESGAEERQPLIHENIRLNIRDHHDQRRQSSRLQWAEASWFRWWYIISWRWLNPLLSLGYKTTITDYDLDELPETDKCSALYNVIKDAKWNQSTTFQIFLAALWRRCINVACIRLPLMIVTIAQPLLLYQLVSDIQQHQSMPTRSSGSRTYGYFCAIGLFACAILQVLIMHQYYFLSTRLDLTIRSLLLSTIFKRLLSINTAALRQITSNYVISIVTNDVAKFEEFFKFIAYVVEGPIEAGINFGLLCWINGFWPTLCGYIIFILLIPLQMLLSRLFGRCRAAVVTHTDQRIRAFEELTSGCQIIKIYNWEKYMETRVHRIRQLELACIRRASLLRAVNMGLFFASMPLIGFATYAGAWFVGQPMEVVAIFITLAFYTQMRFPVMYSLPLAIEKLSEVRLAWQRIDRFIKLTINKERRDWHTNAKDDFQQKGAITMRDASFSWNGHDDCLVSINIDVEPGTFVGVTGVVGSGKSSLFAAILGEMIQTAGEMNVGDSTFSYATQSAWIFADTLRANILFRKPYEEQRYMDVVRACCLDIDLEVLKPHRDLTMIGERGVNLSGGQRARVSLARALYADADIYLLDNPLAAVDPIVAKRIFKQCFAPHGLLHSKTRLLITSQTPLLLDLQQRIFLAHGRVDAQQPLDTFKMVDEKVEGNSRQLEEDTPISSSMLDIGQPYDAAQSIIVNETSKSRNVSCSLWYSLFTAPPWGSFGLYFIIFLILVGQILHDGTNVWLSQSSYLSKKAYYHGPIGIIIYFVLTVATLIVAVGRSSYFFNHILNGSDRFHSKMLSGLLYTSMRFFESNPSGRILNRASKDQQVIDEILPTTLFDAIQLLMMTVGSIFVIITINPWMICLCIVLLPVFYMLCRYYLRSSQQLKRLESTTRSSIYEIVASSLDGLATIRGFKVEDDIIHSFMTLVDANTRPYLYMAGASRWCSCRLDLMATLFSFFPAIYAIVSRGTTNPVLVALSLLYSINITIWFQRGVRQLTEAQNFMTSAERLHEYARLPQEEDNGGSKGQIRTPPDWPDRGSIAFRNYSLSYRSNLEPTLKNINLEIKPGEKVGIIGRTGE